MNKREQPAAMRNLIGGIAGVIAVAFILFLSTCAYRGALWFMRSWCYENSDLGVSCKPIAGMIGFAAFILLFRGFAGFLHDYGERKERELRVQRLHEQQRKIGGEQ